MKKIPNLFLRDWNGNRSRVLPVYNPEADVSWVVNGEGIATAKVDGSACMVRNGKLFVRYDAKPGKTAPAGFEPCQDRDEKTGHMPGWIPAEGNSGAKWHVDAFINSGGDLLPDGTYEACGPSHQTNPHRFTVNLLIRHGLIPIHVNRARFGTPEEAMAELQNVLLSFTFSHPQIGEEGRSRAEGVVWHHPDGRMVKALASDLGLSWKAKTR